MKRSPLLRVLAIHLLRHQILSQAQERVGKPLTASINWARVVELEKGSSDLHLFQKGYKMGYVVCWLDSHDAKIFNFSAEKVDKTELHIKKEDHGVDHFYHRIAEALTPAFEVLVVGPGTAKNQFMHHLQDHHVHSTLLKKIKGVENMDHPTDKQIVAHARTFFHHLEVFKSI